MRVIGLTGGIGCGKSTVARIFTLMGYPVYSADIEAHRLRSQPHITTQIAHHFNLQTPFDNKTLANLVFGDADALQWLNQLIHPLVTSDFLQWTAQKRLESHKVVVMESAILFEAGLETLFHTTLCVTAPTELCLQRLIQRGLSRQESLQRIACQMSMAEKEQRSDFVIHNDEVQSVLKQVYELYIVNC
ncbi:dephospho-CoA kinase [Bacteroidia bacterium]|nr:dephospho-CoA kinase [Bacteroidia bacterium]